MRKQRAIFFLITVFLTCVTACGLTFGFSTVNAGEKQADDFFSTTANAEIITNYSAPAHLGSYKGIFVKALDNGESTVTLNHEIDLRTFTKDDDILTILPVTTKAIEQRQSLEISGIIIRFTDVEDENVFVEIKVQRNPVADFPYASYASARGNGQLFTGWNYNWEDGNIKYHSNNDYGRTILSNFYGRPRAGHTIEEEIKPFSISYDWETSTVHSSSVETQTAIGTMVADLLDADHMKATWSGFKSSKVKLSISANSENLNNKDAGFMILSLGGLDFSQTEWIDKEEPIYELDTCGYDIDNLPNAELFVQYPVYNMVAFDKFDCAYGNSTAEKQVNVSVNKKGQTENVEIVDGYFIPTEMGVYEIHYVATDFSGNKLEKIIEIRAENIQEITHEWKTELSSECLVGTSVVLPEHQVGFTKGEYDVMVKVEDKNGVECKIVNGAFKPQSIGVYKVTVTVTDFLGRQGEFVYNVMAKASKAPILEFSPSIPKVMVLGKSVTLPDFDAYDYYSYAGIKLEATKYYVIKDSIGNVIKTVKPLESFVVDENFGNSVVVEYVAKSYLYEDCVSDSCQVKIIKIDDKLDFANYFITNDKVTEIKKNYSDDYNIAFLFNEEGAKIEYGQALLFNGFDFSFRVSKETNNYSTIYVTLTDYARTDRTVEFKIVRINEDGAIKSLFYLNGDKKEDIIGTFDEQVSDDFRLRIRNGNELVDSRDNFICSINSYASGETFEGFTDNLCYVAFEFGGVTGDSSLEVKKISKQSFDADLQKDEIGPDVKLTSTFKREQTVGEICLAGAVATDVLCGKVDVTVTIENASKVVVYKGKIGTSEQYITLMSSGVYTVKYTAKDYKDNDTTASPIKLYVYDKTDFDVTLNGQVLSSAKKGDTITLPTFTVEDRIFSYDSIVYVVAPKGGLIDVTDSLSFKAEQTGTYKVYYYVVYETDNSYLYKLIERVISVE